MGGGRTRVPRVPQPLLPTPSSSPFISYSSTPPPCPPRAPLDTPISPPLIHPLRIAPLTHSLRIGTGHIFGQPWDPAGVHFFGRGYNKDGTQALRGAGYLSEPSAVELANAIASSAPMRRPDITDPAHWTPRATLRPAHVSPHLDHDLREGWGGEATSARSASTSAPAARRSPRSPSTGLETSCRCRACLAGPKCQSSCWRACLAAGAHARGVRGAGDSNEIRTRFG